MVERSVLFYNSNCRFCHNDEQLESLSLFVKVEFFNIPHSEHIIVIHHKGALFDLDLSPTLTHYVKSSKTK